MNPGISVIICCYNSVGRLPETLKHLAQQAIPLSIPWEVIIIDNASKDGTSNVAREIWGHFNLPHVGFKILEAQMPGKNYAFEKGINESQFDYLVTCDDDNWLGDNFLRLAFHIMESDETIGALGGLGTIEAEQPAVLNTEDLKKLTVHGPQTWATTDHWVYGAGSVYRKNVLLRAMNNGWRKIVAGRTGNKLISGEDVEICFMIYLCGYRIVYDDTLLFKHFIPLTKQNRKFISEMTYWLSYSYFLMYSYLAIINKEGRPLSELCNALLFDQIKRIIKLICIILFKKLTSWQSSTSEQTEALLRCAGMARSIVSNRKKVIEHNHHIQDILEIITTSYKKPFTTSPYSNI